MRRFGVKALSVCGALCAAVTAACDEGGPPASCPATGAAFIVTVTAGGKPLAVDTEVTVRYGGGEETYRLAAPPCCPDVLFCNTVSFDGGGLVEAGPGEPVDALSCAIWTGGSATLEVRASAYADLTEALTAKSDGCGGVMTRQVPIELEPLEGGP